MTVPGVSPRANSSGSRWFSRLCRAPTRAVVLLSRATCVTQTTQIGCYIFSAMPPASDPRKDHGVRPDRYVPVQPQLPQPPKVRHELDEGEAKEDMRDPAAEILRKIQRRHIVAVAEVAASDMNPESVSRRAADARDRRATDGRAGAALGAGHKRRRGHLAHTAVACDGRCGAQRRPCPHR